MLRRTLGLCRYNHLLRLSPHLLDAALQPRHPMVLVRLSDFRRQGQLRRFEEMRDAGLLLYLDKGEDVLALKETALILFFSQCVREDAIHRTLLSHQTCNKLLMAWFGETSVQPVAG